MTDVLNADVVIVGSGVAGSVLAASLAAKGINTLILEAGPRVDRNEAVQRFIDSRDKSSTSPYENTSHAPYPDETRIDDYYVQNGPAKFRGVYLRAAGGTTWHFGGTATRMYPNDFRMRDAYGVALDWPFDATAIEPWYELAERELGVAGSRWGSNGPVRSGDYPLPEIPMTYSDRQIAAAARTFGLTLGSHPQARNSIPYDNRPPCCGSGICQPICPIQAKYDATVHLARAEAAGAKLEVNAVVNRVVVGPDQRVERLEFLRPDGSKGQASGRFYVVAAHAVETPKLLLMSTGERTPNGVANSSDQVGRNLMGHVQSGFFALARYPLYPHRGPVETAGFKEYRDGPTRRDYAAVGSGLSNAGFGGPNAPLHQASALALKGLRGDVLTRTLRERVSREMAIGGSAEMLPNPNNRVRLDAGKRDALGLPRPAIALTIDGYTREGLRRSQQRLRQVVEAMGASEIREIDGVVNTSIIAGTARMGNDPRDSVVNADLCCHDHDNLYILGAATFPTVGVSPPTLTISALALRLAKALTERLHS